MDQQHDSEPEHKRCQSRDQGINNPTPVKAPPYRWAALLLAGLCVLSVAAIIFLSVYSKEHTLVSTNLPFSIPTSTMSVERVFRVDSRVQVSPKTSPPYKWICFLQVSFGRESFIGTGFAINMPLINRKMIVTSGHLVFNRSYANTMRVTFPGKAPVQVTRDDLWAPPEYVNSHDQNYDYGLILLPGQSDEGFGWSTLIPDDELHHRLVSICGFPRDKEENTMWISGGRIESSDQHLLYYEIDTMAGMS